MERARHMLRLALQPLSARHAHWLSAAYSQHQNGCTAALPRLSSHLRLLSSQSQGSSTATVKHAAPAGAAGTATQPGSSSQSSSSSGASGAASTIPPGQPSACQPAAQPPNVPSATAQREAGWQAREARASSVSLGTSGLPSASQPADQPPGAPSATAQHAARWQAKAARATSVSIDTSGLLRGPAHSHGLLLHKEPETAMARHIKSLIRFRGGPITLAEYMSEVLTNPVAGYYTTRPAVFGAAGDFVTSPDVSQLFGEMVGIWVATVWQALGQPPRLHLAELGPGRGTLMADLLRGTAAIAPFASALEIHLVEVSDPLRQQQWRALGCTGSPPPPTAAEGAASAATRASQAAQDAQHEGAGSVCGLTGAPVRWHRSLAEVPRDGPLVILGHEFLDALPVHQFERTGRGWRERLVDVAPDQDTRHLSLVLAPGDTPASRLLLPRRLAGLPAHQRSELQEIEVSAQVMATAGELAERVATQGGAALVIDYGQDGPYGASLAAIRRHAFVHPLAEPGTADLSARVDFGAVRQGVAECGADAVAHGPVAQAHLLRELGIAARLEQLLASASDAQAEALTSGFLRLVGGADPAASVAAAGSAASRVGGDGGLASSAAQQGVDEGEPVEGMGLSYKAMAITPRDMPPPVAFDSAHQP